MTAYGQPFGDRFRLENVPSLVTRTPQNAELAATEIRDDDPIERMTEPLPREDAFFAALMMRDFPHHAYWEDGRQAPITSLRAGDTVLYDLKRDPAVLLDKPFHSIYFYLPRAALNAIADEAYLPRIGDLNYQPGAGVSDDTMRNLGLVMQAALEHPGHASRMFVDHVSLAIAVHVARTYGGLRPALRPAQGGLAPWQEKRAKDILGSNLDGGVALKEVARDCGLSVGHFSRAFRNSTGMAPHLWLMQRRVEAAKPLLRNGALSLSEVALATGFADQSHFTRVFTRATGTSPGNWRLALDA